jgi:CheY-like chemotaxis protein
MPQQPPSILIVENQPAVLALMAEVLRRSGYAVTTAGGGAEALASAEAAGWAVDLLVADLKMPEMTGQELAEDLRRHVPGLRVLYVSAGYADAVVFEVGRGEAHFLPKPFTPSELQAKVKDILVARS